MAWGFTAEWLTERERKRKLQAMGSVSPVKAPTIHGNCELIRLDKGDGGAAKVVPLSTEACPRCGQPATKDPA